MDCSLAGRVVARDVGRDANWLEMFSQLCIQKITVLYMFSWYFLGFVKELSYFPFRISYLNLESAEVIGLIVLSAANFCWKLRGLPTCRCCLYFNLDHDLGWIKMWVQPCRKHQNVAGLCHRCFTGLTVQVEGLSSWGVSKEDDKMRWTCFEELKVNRTLIPQARRTLNPWGHWNHVGVSINGGTPKWMVYKGKSN